MAASRVVLLIAAWAACACAHTHDIHKRMTVEEIRHTFHVDDHDSVPEYEIVNIHHISPRSINTKFNNNNRIQNSEKTLLKNSESLNKKFVIDKLGIPQFDQTSLKGDFANLRLKAFGRHLNLSLAKTEGLFKKGGLKVWTVEPNATAQHGVEYIEVPETNEEVGTIYQDEENEAAMLLRNDQKNGELLVEGSIGADLVVRPLPTHLRDRTTPDLSDDELFLDGDGEEVAIDTGLPIKRQVTKLAQHVIYKRGQKTTDEHFGDYEFMEPDRLHKRHRRATNTTSRRKREAPYIIYPEILVIVDYDGYRLHGGNNAEIKRYFVSFWNGVDLRYKLLKGPRVRISIAGIIISRGRDATPYLERNRVGRDAIDSAAALTDMGKYLFQERRLPVYDIAVAITKLDMCRRAYANDVCNRGTAGFAYVGGACVVNKRLSKVNSVAIIEDTGGFSGIIVAAHEVGHLLGAVHDGSPPPSYLGGPGAEKCRWEDGYIMSDLRHTERGFRWSSCSISSFHHFLNGETATCLFNAPHEDDSLPRVLPGKLLSLDAQCRKDRGTSACFKDDRVCAQLFCFDAGSGYCVAYRPAAEGSPCGDGQYCINGQCVAEHENIIPDYSQNTPSYIRRQDENQGRPLFHDDEETTPEIIQQTQPPYYQQYTTTTSKPYSFFNQYSTTPKPYTSTPYYTTPISFYPTQSPYTTPRTNPTHSSVFNYYSISTTRNPYDFRYLFSSFTTQRPQISYTTKSPFSIFSGGYQTQSTTKNPYVGDYYNLRSKTTKSSYDFGDFGRTTKNYFDNINNNYLKRSYNNAQYYSASSNRHNVTLIQYPRLK